MTDMLDSPGIRVGNELNVFLPADTKLRCIGDRIIVEPLDWKPSSIIFVAGYEGKPLRGIVRGVGPGCYPIQYQDAETGRWSFSVPKGRRKAMRPSRAFRPCDVKVGDVVEFGGLEIGGFLHPTIMWGHKEVVLCREEDVAGVSESSVPLYPCECGDLLQYHINRDAYVCRGCKGEFSVLSTERDHVAYDGGPPKRQQPQVQADAHASAA